MPIARRAIRFLRRRQQGRRSAGQAPTAPTSSSSTMPCRPGSSGKLERELQCMVIDRHRADPRHLRAARAQSRRQAAGPSSPSSTPGDPPRARLTHLERQKGGIGSCGPGEKQPRRTAARSATSQRCSNPGSPDREAAQGSSARSGNAATFCLISLVGYTNAGKSTLFNALIRQAPTRRRTSSSPPRHHLAQVGTSARGWCERCAVETPSVSSATFAHALA